MRAYSNAILIAALAVPAFCQERPPAPPTAFVDQAEQLDLHFEEVARAAQELSTGQVEQLTAQADMLASQIDAAGIVDKLDLSRVNEMADRASAMAEKFSVQFDDAKIKALTDRANAMAEKFDMAFLQAPKPVPAAPAAPPAPPAPKAMTLSRTFTSMRDSAYNAGTRAIDQHHYDEAVQRFDSAILQEPERADGALYWKAYALNREGKGDEALSALAQLRREHAASAWLKDAQVLEAEVRQNLGKPAAAGDENNDDLKLMAINSLMNADAERAIPLLEGILKGTSTPAVKDRALFVLSQNKSVRAQQALVDYAKAGGNPDLQLRAIQYVGMSGTKDAQQQLAAIYSATTDARAKSSIIQAMMMAHAIDALLNIAKTEKDASLRNAAIRSLAMDKRVATESLVEIYSGGDVATKKEIINGFTAKGDGKTLVDLAHKEGDPVMKKTIVERLSGMRDNKDATDYMMELLK